RDLQVALQRGDHVRGLDGRAVRVVQVRTQREHIGLAAVGGGGQTGRQRGDDRASGRSLDAALEGQQRRVDHGLELVALSGEVEARIGRQRRRTGIDGDGPAVLATGCAGAGGGAGGGAGPRTGRRRGLAARRVTATAGGDSARGKYRE